MNYRTYQQIRLWLYTIALIFMAVRGMYGYGRNSDIFLFAAIGALPFLEVCPSCRRLAWRERPEDASTSTFWIASNCRVTGTPPDGN